MRHGSLFSGIGGFDLAAEWMGWSNSFHCEWNEFGQRVLKHYWPKAISYEDITKVDFRPHRGNIDIISGGFPCQPFSAAGKRKGTEDDRHLWPEMLRAIREIEPTYVVGENVRGLLNWSGGLVFDEVCADLETCGYSVQPFLLPACAVNAPHKRDRIWFIARRDAPDSDSKPNRCISNSRSDREVVRGQSEKQKAGSVNGSYCDGDASDTSDKRLQGSKQPRKNQVKNRGRGKSAHGSTSKCDSYSDWQDFPTQPPICGGNDGLPSKLDRITFPKWRNESIKAYGNAIVPAVALQIFKAIELDGK